MGGRAVWGFSCVEVVDNWEGGNVRLRCRSAMRCIGFVESVGRSYAGGIKLGIVQKP